MDHQGLLVINVERLVGQITVKKIMKNVDSLAEIIDKIYSLGISRKGS